MPAPLPLRVDPVADALASIDAPPFALDAALRRQLAEAAAWTDFSPSELIPSAEVPGTFRARPQREPTPDEVRRQLGGADPRPALELLVSAVADDLRREAPEAMNGAPARSGVPSDDASALAAHLREKHRTRATEPEYHARRLAESRRALARIARVDRFTAERLAAGDDPTEATLRVFRFVRAAWSGVPGGMDGAPEAAPTLAEFVAAHVAHAERLRARQSDAGREPGPTPPPMGEDAERASIPLEHQTPPVSRAFAARVKGDTFATFAGKMNRREVRWAEGHSPERTVFDARQFVPDVPTRSRDAVDAVFRCFEKSREQAEAILRECDKFEPAEIDAMLARLFPPRRRKPGR